jgi:acyl transferase domain-containing protein
LNFPKRQREAIVDFELVVDPQQRLLLETTYEALENAGIPMETVRGSNTSVFVGVYGRDFDRMGYKDLPQITKAHTTGAGEAIMSNRISYLFDLKGASMTIDTGCVRVPITLLAQAHNSLSSSLGVW